MPSRRKEMAMRLHPETGEALHRDVRPFTVAYKGRSKVVRQPGWYPDGEGDALFEGHDLEAAEMALAQLKSLDRKATAKQVRAIRQRLKLSQRRAGIILGGGPRAFQKYESGEVVPSEPMRILLWLLERDPRLLKVLPERLKERRRPEAKRYEAT